MKSDAGRTEACCDTHKIMLVKLYRTATTTANAYGVLHNRSPENTLYF